MRNLNLCTILMLAVLAAGCSSDMPTAPGATRGDPPEPISIAPESDDVARKSTQGLALPQGMNFDFTGNFVGEVLITVQGGWLKAPHLVDVTITSVNGQPFHFHGNQVEALDDLAVFGTISGGLADVVVPWVSDEEPKRVDDLYTVCAHVIFGGKHPGSEACADFGPF